MKLKGKVVVVTGAASGIGRAAWQLCVKEGAKVVALDKQGMARPAGCGPSSGMSIIADVSVEKEVADAMRLAKAKFGRIDVLCNNAGSYFEKSTLACSSAEWQEVLQANLTSVFFCCKYALQYMRPAGRGAVVNISSTDALMGEESCAAYCAAKAGVIGLTRSLAKEAAPWGVRVNCIAPGPVVTPMFRKFNSPREILDIRRNVPLQRLGTAEDVARGILFLASDDASFITGEVLSIDGGITGAAGVGA